MNFSLTLPTGRGKSGLPVMQIAQQARWRLLSIRKAGCRCFLGHFLSALCCATLTGCAALTNPVANGIPVHLLPQELLGESKDDLEPIPLTSLGQPPPETYRLAPEDVLGIWVEGILGEKSQAPPVRYTETGKLPPAIGFPIPVRADGTVSLPLIAPLKVQGMSLEEAEAAIRNSYTVENKIIQPGRERIIVTLQQPRRYHILVIRQDGGTETSPGVAGNLPTGGSTGFVVGIGGGPSTVRRGRGFAIDLAAYENDVLNALARTGGFPGTDSVNEIVIERGNKGKHGPADLMSKSDDLRPGNIEGGQVFRIPLRVRPGERLNITPEMVTLQTGDVVYIEARNMDVYYTGGLLPPGAHQLPRDYDLDVVEAIVRSGGTLNSGGISAANISGSTTQLGIGSPSPSLVTVLRRTANGGQLAIRVDLNRAFRDPRERIRIQPKDLIMLQEQPQEALARYITNVFHVTSVYQFLTSSKGSSTANLVVP
jgi:hypothetical protein